MVVVMPPEVMVISPEMMMARMVVVVVVPSVGARLQRRCQHAERKGKCQKRFKGSHGFLLLRAVRLATDLLLRRPALVFLLRPQYLNRTAGSYVTDVNYLASLRGRKRQGRVKSDIGYELGVDMFKTLRLWT